MHTREVVEAAVRTHLRKTFSTPAEEYVGAISIDYDAEILEWDDAKLVLEVEVYVSCDEHDQESAAILAREEWWAEVRQALKKALGLDVETRGFHMHW